jgi:murein DD-endopeptidase MepM/ murein hydrolase activator NlpD
MKVFDLLPVPFKSLVVTALLIYLWGMVGAVSAAPPQQGPLYTVQPQDTLILVALRHNLKVADLILANHLDSPYLLTPGQRLLLPGLGPIIASASDTFRQHADLHHTIQPGETLFNIAYVYGVSVEEIVTANQLADPNMIQVGDKLEIPGDPPPLPKPLPAPFRAVELSETTIIQGRTLALHVTLSHPEAILGGQFDDRPIFFTGGGGQFAGLAAIHALAEPGVYSITLVAYLPDGTAVTTTQDVTVLEGPYGREAIELDENRSQLLDPELVKQEQQKLDLIWSQHSPRPAWDGPFSYPVDLSQSRTTSYYGTRRSYNGAPGFHAGVDFGGGTGKTIYAPADGRVVLAEKLAVRGNAVIIDHGMGLFSGYWHQSKIAVTAGQKIARGDIIGYVGSTGLVTGPHLHWEMRLGGVAVQPLQWVQESLP